MTTGGRSTNAVLAVLFVIVLLIVARVAISKLPVAPIHKDAASVPSTTGVADTNRYAAAVEESRHLARTLVAGDNIPGLSVAVAVDGEIVWAEGFGRADIDGATPLTPLTRFRLGALSKPLIAVAAARLTDQGRLDLDAPVQTYVKAYPEKQWKVTTRQLLSDVAGVHRIRGDNNDAMPGETCRDLDEAVALFSKEPLLFEPGTQHRYSIYGWVLASAVVESAGGEPLASVMTRQVFDPLKMERTVLAETDDIDGMTPVDAPKSTFGIRVGVKKASRPNYTCLAGAGAFLSTPTDLVRLGSAMMGPGLLKEETIKAFATPTHLPSGATSAYALGWTVGEMPVGPANVRMLSHRGSPSGGTVSLVMFPDLGIAIAAAGNATDAKGVNPFARQVADVFARHRTREARVD